MTNTKATVKKSVKNVKAAAKKAVKANKVVEALKDFDIKAALSAGKKAPKNVNAVKESKCLQMVKEILSSASEGLTMAQIKEAYFNKLGIKEADKKQNKQVYETVFQHSDVCHNKGRDPKKAIFTRDKNGVYKMK